MARVSTTMSFGWLNLDSWSEPYVGAYWIVSRQLPAEQHQTASHHGPLCQMVLLTSHHLVEVMFFKCVRSLIERRPGVHGKIETGYEKANFGAAFKAWPSVLVGTPFDMDSEPFKSAVRLATQRNATIHKESALVTLDMARSALFSAVRASEAIADHLLGPGAFKYGPVLAKYTLAEAEWFSTVRLVGSAA